MTLTLKIQGLLADHDCESPDVVAREIVAMMASLAVDGARESREEAVAVLGEGVARVAVERDRQRYKFDDAHDDAHDDRELAKAALCYLVESMGGEFGGFVQPPEGWPFGSESWQPGERVDDLTKAGALIAAEIDRLLR